MVDSSTRRRAASFIRARTILLAVGTTVVAATVTSLTAVEAMAPDVATLAADVLLPAALLLSGTIALVAAVAMRDGNQRRAWLFVAAGVLGAGLGEAGYAWSSHFSGRPMGFPGPQELFFAIQYGAWIAAFAFALASPRVTVERGLPLLEGAAISAMVGTALWIVEGREALAGGTVAEDLRWYAVYLLLDFVLIVPPAIALIMAVVRSSDPFLTVGWVTFSVAALIVVASDVGWLLLALHDAWEPGSLVDFGWMCGYGLAAVAASAALDAEKARARLAASEG